MRNRFLYSKNFYENYFWKQQLHVCGVDEVGRGCLAGPVVSAAVILFPNSKYSLLKDSKILDKNDREKAFNWIVKNSWYSWSAVDNFQIDNINIWNATLKSMRQSVLNVIYLSSKVPEVVLVDAMPLSLKNSSYSSIEVQNFIKGEQNSTSIAAASIVAKVIRDRMMEKMTDMFPLYSFERHKGYSTKLHKNLLKENGYSIIHRLSYLKNLKEEIDGQQRSLFG